MNFTKVDRYHQVSDCKQYTVSKSLVFPSDAPEGRWQYMAWHTIKQGHSEPIGGPFDFASDAEQACIAHKKGKEQSP